MTAATLGAGPPHSAVSLNGEHILAKLAEQFDAHPDQIPDWKWHLFEGAENAFDQEMQ